MTAYVHGPDSAHYDFTSALPVQLLVKLAPSLMPMIERQDTVTVPGLHVERAAPAPAGPADAVARDTEQAAPADASAVETTSGTDAVPRTSVTDDRAPAKVPAAKAAEPKASEPKAAKPAAKAAEPGVKPVEKPAVKAAEKPAAKPAEKSAAAEQHPKAAAVIKATADGQPKPAVRKADTEAQAKPARKPAAKPDADADVPPKAQRAKPPAVEEVLQ
jgi:hypothetical protein